MDHAASGESSTPHLNLTRPGATLLWEQSIPGALKTLANPIFRMRFGKFKQSYFREAEDRTQTMLDKALAPATDKSSRTLGPAEGPANGGVAIFNTQSWPHGGLITLSKAESAKGDRVYRRSG